MVVLSFKNRKRKLRKAKAPAAAATAPHDPASPEAAVADIMAGLTARLAAFEAPEACGLAVSAVFRFCADQGAPRDIVAAAADRVLEDVYDVKQGAE